MDIMDIKKFQNILNKEKITMFFIKNDPNIWYYTKGSKIISRGGRSIEDKELLKYLLNKTIIIPKKGHIFKPFKPFHYWKQKNEGVYKIIPND